MLISKLYKKIICDTVDIIKEAYLMNKLRLKDKCSDKWLALVLMTLFAFIVVLMSFSIIVPVYLFIRYIVPIALGICLMALQKGVI